MSCPVTVVMITRNRAAGLNAALEKLTALAERPEVIVVDNGSTDRTAEVIGAAGPRVRGIHLGGNAGAAGRNAGVAAAETPYVAFSDDDSWWAPGALARVAAHFERHSRLALIAARVLVGQAQRVDAMCTEMARSPLPRSPDLPGPNVLGFIACGVAVRRSAYMEAGGFHPRFGVGGEESLLCIDLAWRGWGLCYCDDVVALHYPAPSVPRPGRQARLVRNRLWTSWLRCSPRAACSATARIARAAFRDRGARAGLVDALRGMPWVWRERAPVDHILERELDLVLPRN